MINESLVDNYSLQGAYKSLHLNVIYGAYIVIMNQACCAI